MAGKAAPEATLLRVQDDEGRGPFMPGFSRYWVDDTDEPRPLPWFQEFGDIRSKLRPGFHWGCAVRTYEQLDKWFTKSERARLAALGYFLVQIVPDIILAESENQVVFGRKFPLRWNVSQAKWSAHG